MNDDGMINRFNMVAEWIYFLLKVQVLWWLGLFCGGIIFGFFPATFSLFGVMRKRLQLKEEETWSLFWRGYRENFVITQLVGFMSLGIGLFLYMDIRILQSYETPFAQLMANLLIGISIIHLLCSSIVAAVYVHFRLRIRDIVKLAVTIIITQPAIALGISFVLGVTVLFLLFLPILVFLIGFSMCAYFVMKLALASFQKVEEVEFIRSPEGSST
ncbi:MULTISPECIES: DUF624 domain-containing protein [unclassified Sutcliffiella]|uniref:YesL family protein n=1 Tax=unclassified Sutcliffiella TaxID=2837532 RepID=UPI0030D443C0